MPGNSFSTAATRRRFLSLTGAVAASTALSACGSLTPRMPRLDLVPEEPRFPEAPPPPADPGFGDPALMYGPVFDQGFDLPRIPVERVDPQFLRQIVSNPTGEPPGTIVIDTSRHFLYLVREYGEAIRYGVGLGRAGFEWSGRGVIEWKQAWPRWFPPAEMIARQPELEPYRARQIPGTNNWEGGMPGGPTNPLGARALYIFQDEKDTLYRLHGSPEWNSIGKSVSSGCVRLMNQDIIDLFERVPEKTPIVVLGGAQPSAGIQTPPETQPL